MDDSLKRLHHNCNELSDVPTVMEFFETVQVITAKYHENPQQYPDLIEKLHTASNVLEEIIESRSGCFCCPKKDVTGAQLQDIRQAHDQVIFILDGTIYGGRGTPPKVLHPDVETFWSTTFGDTLVIKSNQFVKAVVGYLIKDEGFQKLEGTAMKHLHTHLYAYADGYLLGERTMIRKEELSSLLDGLSLKESFENFQPVEEKRIQEFLTIFKEERSMVAVFEALSNRVPHSCNISRLIDLIANLLNSDNSEIAINIEEDDVERDNIEILVASIRRASVTSLQFGYYLLKLILIKGPDSSLDRIRSDLTELNLPSLMAIHLAKYKENVKIVHNICNCITYLCIVPHNIKQLMREEQVLKALISCISYHGAKEYDEAVKILPSIFEAIRHAVCGVPLSRQTVSESQGDSMIVSCLHRFGNDSEIVIKGCGAIQNIVCMNSLSKEKLNTSSNDVPDFARVLINLLQNTLGGEKDKTDEKVADEIESICRAMRNYVAHNKIGKDLLFEHGIVETFEGLILEWRNNLLVIGRICSVIENLGTKNDTRALFNESGFYAVLPKILVDAETSIGNSELVDAIRFIISALKTLGCDKDTLVNLKAHGFLHYLTRLSKSKNSSFSEIALNTLNIYYNRLSLTLGANFFNLDINDPNESSIIQIDIE
eukprot:TRINITY_DN2264_c0_g2_i1.p1 TRINITY_DN2264_c0_g2~~TRINITY_DN2264_c0_g2_i1.p1  ORF type:complete len:669 (+),score=196.95 TRINITY_DN2264_c0_g2_i1:39-2009(+)